MKIEIRQVDNGFIAQLSGDTTNKQVDNGFIAQLSGDTTNKQVKAKEKVACSIVELMGVIAEHLREVYGEDRG